ncbi:hypothetical protein [Roseivirga echinicomitans]|uniref:Uncharacterized protein n=1 Tax=Roseivirga echinicomitans TaxID=296218 RepID=A0A150XQ80_9BACT|nr:hypothetical protein [Roseivirga echinicomitans]KYG80742.1 hypothetical protein AWN68_16675 [Roseivirga echinicomitans]
MENYLEDLINQLVEEAYEIKANSNDEFEKGKLFGYYQAISLILNQAEAFGLIDRLPLKWRDFKPEVLLSKK